MIGRSLSKGPGLGGVLLAPFAQPAHQPHGHIHPLEPPRLAGRLIVVADHLPGLGQGMALTSCPSPRGRGEQTVGQHAAEAVAEAGQTLVEADG